MQNTMASAFIIHLFCLGNKGKKQMKWKIHGWLCPGGVFDPAACAVVLLLSVSTYSYAIFKISAYLCNGRGEWHGGKKGVTD